jgi:hypothetical protein
VVSLPTGLASRERDGVPRGHTVLYTSRSSVGLLVGHTVSDTGTEAREIGRSKLALMTNGTDYVDVGANDLTALAHILQACRLVDGKREGDGWARGRGSVATPLTDHGTAPAVLARVRHVQQNIGALHTYTPPGGAFLLGAVGAAGVATGDADDAMGFPAKDTL